MKRRRDANRGTSKWGREVIRNNKFKVPLYLERGGEQEEERGGEEVRGREGERKGRRRKKEKMEEEMKGQSANT